MLVEHRGDRAGIRTASRAPRRGLGFGVERLQAATREGRQYGISSPTFTTRRLASPAGRKNAFFTTLYLAITYLRECNTY